MKAIILCAGLGTRTGLEYPKCLYKFKNGPTLLEKNLETLKRVGFKKSDIIFVTGFKSSLIKRKTKNLYSYVHNRNFKITNMVFSFYEVIKKYHFHNYYIFYADIIFKTDIIEKLIRSNKKISTLIDTDWLKKWKKKKNYLEDLEELIIKKNRIISLGKKTKNLKKIEGRFVGITKFSKQMIRELEYHRVFQKILKEDKNIDFTNFLMKLIKLDYEINSLRKKIHWYEFDNIHDFKTFEKIKNNDFF